MKFTSKEDINIHIAHSEHIEAETKWRSIPDDIFLCIF